MRKNPLPDLKNSKNSETSVIFINKDLMFEMIRKKCFLAFYKFINN